MSEVRQKQEDGNKTRRSIGGQNCPELDLTFPGLARLSDVNVENVEVGTK